MRYYNKGTNPRYINLLFFFTFLVQYRLFFSQPKFLTLTLTLIMSLFQISAPESKY